MSADGASVRQRLRLSRGSQCLDPDDVRARLKHSTSREWLMSNLASHQLCLLGETPYDGDCFWHAICRQLERLNLPRRTARQLRREVVEFIRKNPVIQGPDGEIDLKESVGGDIQEYCDKMAKDGEWADHPAILATAKSLQRDIFIVTSARAPKPDDYITWIVGKEGFSGEPLLIGHVHENHYVSLQSREEASSATLTGGGGDSLPTPYVIQPISPGTSDLQGPAHQETNFSGSSSTKKMSVLERMKLKHSMKGSTSYSSPEPGHSTADHSSTPTTMADDPEKFLKRAQDVISELQDVLSRAPSCTTINCLDKWREAASSLKKQISLPSCTIALVGESGHGKSSLLNALLDQNKILPTSAVKACTAVVIEVTNSTGQNYEADIEFFTKEEWQNELKLLWGSLETETGTICKIPPDQNQAVEAHEAWSKVQAVYGEFSPSDTLEDLMRPNEVTKHLDTVYHIEEDEVDSFMEAIELYVKESLDESQGQFWPIIKKVRVGMPASKVCRGGTMLVDLPGSRDSNAARDNVAQKFLKNCSHVMVVADIERAVTSKTAKDLMGEHFRRQLLMDGHYKNLSLVCTKSDDIGSADVIERELKNKHEGLSEQLKPHKDAFRSIKAKKEDLETKRKTKDKELKMKLKEEKSLNSEINELKNDCSELKEEQLSGTELVERDELLAGFEQTLLEKEDKFKVVCSQLITLQEAVKTYKSEISTLSADMNRHRKSQKLICAKARNEFVRNEIRKDFRKGIKEMLEQSDMAEEDVAHMAQNLKVFCVSSLDYQKTTLPDEDEPEVYDQAADTEIPTLQKFVQSLSEEPRRRQTQLLLQSLQQLLIEIKSHLSDSGTENTETRDYLNLCIVDQVGSVFREEIEEVLKKESKKLEELFDILVPKIKEGAKQGTKQAVEISKMWGRPPNKFARWAGGYTWGTYRATCRRNGIYNSRANGAIDFNQDLANPLLTEITNGWHKVFNVNLEYNLDEFCVAWCEELEQFAKKMESVCLGEASRLAQCGEQFLEAARRKMAFRLEQIKADIVDRQRDISRMIIPTIQEAMLKTYFMVSQQTGAGSFDRMKKNMELGVEAASSSMYDAADMRVQKELDMLKTAIVTRLRHSVDTLLPELLVYYEPLWESPSNVASMKRAMDEDIHRLLSRVETICGEANVPLGPQRSASQMASTAAPRKRSDSTDEGPPEKVAKS